MKKYLLFSVLGIAMLMVSGCSTDQVSQEEETPYIPPSETTTSYTIPDQDIDFEYPDNWSIEEPGEDADEYDLFSVSTPNGNSMDVKYYPEDTEFEVNGKTVDFSMWFDEQYQNNSNEYESHQEDIDFWGESIVYLPTKQGVVYCHDKNLSKYFFMYTVTNNEVETKALRSTAESFCMKAYGISWNKTMDTSDWKTYINEEYEFLVKVPQGIVGRDKEIYDNQIGRIEFLSQSVINSKEDRGYLAADIGIYHEEVDNFEKFLQKRGNGKNTDQFTKVNENKSGYEVWEQIEDIRNEGKKFYIFNKNKQYEMFMWQSGGYADESVWTLNSMMETFEVMR